MPDLISQKNELASIKHNYPITSTIVGIVLILIFFYGLITENEEAQMLGFFVFIIFLGALAYSTKNEAENFLKHWAKRRGFQYQQMGDIEKQERLTANPQKELITKKGEIKKKYLITGTIQNKKFWVYEVGIVFGPRYNDKSVIREWCLEIEVGPDKEYVLISRASLMTKDNMNTESVDFENKYRLYVKDPRHTLQLLDPHVMSLLLEYKIDGLEVSDSSIIFYNSRSYFGTSNWNRLDEILNYASTIAKQVDKNFPMAKHEKRFV